MKKALQMYAVRALCKESLEKALKKVSEIGFDGVEFAGFYDCPAEEVAGWLKKYHLEVMGAHIHAEEIFDKAAETIQYQTVLGNKRIICPYYDLKTRADVEELAAKMNAVADQYRAAGMKLYYHNHWHEFAKDGEDYLIDILAALVPADVLSLEFDVYWIYRGGEEPVKYLKKYQDRIDIFHAKDGTMEKGTIAGTGNVPLEEVLKLAQEIDIQWAVVESEASAEKEEQIDAATKDFAYISSLTK